MTLPDYNILHSTFRELGKLRGNEWYEEVLANGVIRNLEGIQILFICEETFIAINKKYGYENAPTPVPHLARGLGDSIAKITDRIGIRTPIHNLTGGKCGCQNRQTTLNKLLKY